MNAAQDKVSIFNTAHALHREAHVRLLDLLSELGETSKEYLTYTDYGRVSFLKSPEWEAELGDLYYSLLSLANETEIDLDGALKETLDKYTHRIEEKKTPGSPAV